MSGANKYDKTDRVKEIRERERDGMEVAWDCHVSQGGLL